VFCFLDLGSKWTHEGDSFFGMLKLNGAKQNKKLGFVWSKEWWRYA